MNTRENMEITGDNHSILEIAELQKLQLMEGTRL